MTILRESKEIQMILVIKVAIHKEFKETHKISVIMDTTPKELKETLMTLWLIQLGVIIMTNQMWVKKLNLKGLKVVEKCYLVLQVIKKKMKSTCMQKKKNKWINLSKNKTKRRRIKIEKVI